MAFIPSIGDIALSDRHRALPHAPARCGFEAASLGSRIAFGEASIVSIATMPSRCRVLVADDNHDSADSLVDLLRAKGHVAFAAYDGQDAVEVCADFHPDLAILDVQMPLMDGCAAARLMRDGRQPPRMIASLTGMSPDEEPLRSGGQVFAVELSKPPKVAEIDALIEKTHCADS